MRHGKSKAICFFIVRQNLLIWCSLYVFVMTSMWRWVFLLMNHIWTVISRVFEWSVLVKQHSHALSYCGHVCIIECKIDIIQHLKPRKPSFKVEGYKHNWKSHAFVNTSTKIITNTFTKVSSMPKHKLPQIPKFCNRIISKGSSLISFLTHYSNSNVCWLNHVNIICTITNSKSNLAFLMVSNKFNYLSFLFRRCSKDYYSNCIW